ncbi:MAG: bacterioferritin [Roseibium sp.]|uniref:bacterioferritin n=1 Tax=Roseibium sp. TaxID=1936156 RepID=UPI001B118CEA|nr:bacterioferritin [Roseibium sp.]MBO6890342.1 bacterioferritin [Roseibium sp.]MBO6931171.1 bacterioferritin [Roseibium sp.]
MKGEAKVIDYLNKSLRHELTVVNQFWVHARLLEDWGFSKLADKQLVEADEERQHAQDLMDRIIFLEGLPNLQTLDPLRIGQSVKECLECDLAAEYVARALYNEAREVCRDHNDYVTMGLFEKLLSDEEGHIDFLETQLGLIEQIGIDNYSLLQAKSADNAE